MFFTFFMISAAFANERVPLKQMNLMTPPNGHPYRVTVKFLDSLKMRVGKKGELTPESTVFGQWAYQNGVRFQPLFGLSPLLLKRFEHRARLHSGHQQPDFSGMIQ